MVSISRPALVNANALDNETSTMTAHPATTTLRGKRFALLPMTRFIERKWRWGTLDRGLVTGRYQDSNLVRQSGGT